VGRKCSLTWGNNDPRRPYNKIILDPEEQGIKKGRRRVIEIGR
jgi:hypothetical protein